MNSQDMVVEFARMNSFQVLEETEKAVSHIRNCANDVPLYMLYAK